MCQVSFTLFQSVSFDLLIMIYLVGGQVKANAGPVTAEQVYHYCTGSWIAPHFGCSTVFVVFEVEPIRGTLRCPVANTCEEKVTLPLTSCNAKMEKAWIRALNECGPSFTLL